MTDAERDRYLQEALRHAPDADAAPPPALSAAILREAQAAVAPAQPSWRDRAAAFWQALASPRLAGALASLMVLTIAGVMWWGRPIEDAMPERAAPVAMAPAPVAASEQAVPAQAPAAEAATAAPPPVEAKQPAVDTPPPPAAKAESRRAAPADAPARSAKERQPSITAAAPPPAPAPDDARARSEASRDAVGAAAPAMPAAPAAVEPPPAMAAAPPPVADIAAAQKAAARSAPSVAALSGAASTPARLALSAGATSWDSGDGRARAVDAEFAAFLAQLEAAAEGSGLVARLAPLAERNAARSAATATLNLQRDGQPLRSLRLAGDQLTIETPDGATRRVPLAPGSGAALAARLAELAR